MRPQRAITGGLLALGALIMLVHAWGIADIPKGLFIDESSLGYNALLLSQTAKDEYGHFLPPVIDSFGDAKSALFAYGAAFIFLIFGASDWSLRFTSVVFFGLFLLGLTLLVRRLFPKKPMVWTYALLAAGFLPWFFTISRIAFEVISLLPCTVWSLYFLHRTFAPQDKKHASPWNAIVCGILIGLSLYSYATPRLSTFLFLGSIALVYGNKQNIARLTSIFLAVLITGLPYFLYLANHRGMVMGRFLSITYINDPLLSFSQKLHTFSENYFWHLSPRFLLLSGDPNLRHATGFGGELFFAVFLLALAGILVFFLKKTWRENPFFILLFLQLLLAPVAAALTQEALPHALRSILIGVFLLLFSILCFAWISDWKKETMRMAAITFFLCFLLFESADYVQDYFLRYGPQSFRYFDSYGMREATDLAFHAPQKTVIFSQKINYAQYEFFRRTTPYASHLFVSQEEALPRPGACIIYLPSDDKKMQSSNLPLLEQNIPDAMVRLRCYKP
jgi:hypothetical protein